MTISKFDAPPAFPYTLNGGTEIELQLSLDATVGVQLDHLRHKIGGPFDHITKLVDTGELEELDGRLWELTFSLSPSTTPEGDRIHPGLATDFDVWDVTSAYGATAAALLFVWSGVEVPRAVDGDLLRVVVLLRVDTNDWLSKWSISVSRERGASASIDHVHFPILWVKGPSTPEGVESHHEGQKRTRVITPANTLAPARIPAGASNTDLWTWADGGLEAELDHPSVGLPLQFVALASAHDGGPADPAWRQPLYLAAEDGAHYSKHAHLRGYRYTGGGADDGYLHLSIGHDPSFREELGDQSVATDYGNSYIQPYPVVLGARQADADGNIWFDVASWYRERVVAIGAMPPEIESSLRLTAAVSREPTAWMGGIHLGSFASITQPELFEGFLRYLDILRRGCRGPDAALSSTYLQFQVWLNGGLPVVNPARELFKDLTYGAGTGLEAVLAAARENGVIPIAYTRPGDLLDELEWVLPRQAIRVLRDGSQGRRSDGFELDDTASLAAWWGPNMTRLIQAAGFRGQYNDGLGGGDATLSYPPNGEEHPRHGGSWGSEQRLALIDGVRAEMIDADASIGTESVEEGLAHAINVQQGGLMFYPGHTLLMEEAVRLAITNSPTVCRHMHPPLWDVVYHGRIPSQHLGLHLGNCLLATNGDWNPSAGAPGLTAVEFVDVFCWLYGTILAHGNVPLLFQDQHDFDAHDPTVTGSPSGVANSLVLIDEWGSISTDPTKDFSGTGRTILAFLRLLHQAQRRDFAGDMVQFGQMLRPLSPDYTSVNNSRQTNPLSALDPAHIDLARNRFWGMLPAVAAIALQVNATLFNWQIDATFEVPDAIHSMWQSPEGVVGLVIVNWSASAATFRATFDPAVYGVSTPYDIIQRRLGDTPVTLAAAVGAGAHVIGNSGIVDTALPAFGAHTVWVFTFEP